MMCGQWAPVVFAENGVIDGMNKLMTYQTESGISRQFWHWAWHILDLKDKDSVVKIKVIYKSIKQLLHNTLQSAEIL